MEILEKLFGSAARVKIIRLFLFNPDSAFDTKEASSRVRVSRGLTRREIANLERIGFIKLHQFVKEIKKQKDRTVTSVKKRARGWILDRRFPYIEILESFFSDINPFKHKDVVEKISHTGKIQLLVISGIFIKYEDARVDLLIVGDNIKQGQLDGIIAALEADLGQEIRYALFDTAEFNYRISLFDKLVRDILDYPHQKIINKLGL